MKYLFMELVQLLVTNATVKRSVDVNIIHLQAHEVIKCYISDILITINIHTVCNCIFCNF